MRIDIYVPLNDYRQEILRKMYFNNEVAIHAIVKFELKHSKIFISIHDQFAYKLCYSYKVM